MGRKSRHYRQESDPLLSFYQQNLGDSIRNSSNPLYSSSSPPMTFSPPKRQGYTEKQNEMAAVGSTATYQSTEIRGNGITSCYDDDAEEGGQAPKGHHRVHSFGGYYKTQKNYDVLSKTERKREKKKKGGGGYRVHRVSYTPHDHIHVMFRMYGSAFPNVFPFVVVNILWSLLVFWLKRLDLVDLSFHSGSGHSFMGLLVSFLIVSRSQIAYQRYMEYRKLLATCYQCCREIVQFSTVYTNYTNTDLAKQWRLEVCYRTCLMLRVTMDALLWASTVRHEWEEEYYAYQLTPETTSIKNVPSTSSTEDEEDEEKANLIRPGGGTVGESDEVSEHFFRFRNLTHGRRSRVDEHFRAPITFMHILRNVIMDHPQYLNYKMAVNEYRDLLDFVTKFDTAFHGFRVLVFTPYPFPLVQMTRAFLFFWVYTLPLVLLDDYRLPSTLLIVIVTTFGFIGIEYVSMALEDPIADATNDIDEHGMALLVYEDIYMALYRTDGPEAAEALRGRILARYKKGRALDCFREDMKGEELWEPAYARHERLGPCPDWSSNPPPPPIIPSQATTTVLPTTADLHQSSTTNGQRRRRPPTHPTSFNVQYK